MKNQAKTLKIFGGLIAGVALGVLILYTYYHYQTSYCVDVVPDTPNIYVYAADMWYAELNRRYADEAGIEIEGDEYRMITYEDVPEIASMEGVTGVYVFDDAELNDFAERIYAGGDVSESIPKDVYTYYYDQCGLAGVFEVLFGGAPADGASQLCAPSTWQVLHPDYKIGDKVTFDGAEYTLVGYNKNNFAWTSLGSSSSIYYRYDPSTWEAFLARLASYLEENDAVSDVNMMICCDEDRSSDIQKLLVSRYPASNYTSAEFVRAWKDNYNKVFWTEQIWFMVIVIVVTAGAEVAIFYLGRRKKSSL